MAITTSRGDIAIVVRRQKCEISGNLLGVVNLFT
jgi:hypothetical protein